MIRRSRDVLALATALAAVCVPVATAVSGPDANDNSKFVYAETIAEDTNNLVVTFDEGAQKRFPAVDYRLEATAVVTRACDGQSVAEQLFPTATATGFAPSDKGRVSATLTLDVIRPTGLICTGGRFSIEYSAVALTNTTSGRVYRLDDVSRTVP